MDLSTANSSVSSLARTVAVLGDHSSSASSPKESPGVNVLSTVVSPVSGCSSSMRKGQLPHDEEVGRAVALPEYGFAGPICDQSNPACQIREGVVPEFVERGESVDRLGGFDTPRCLEPELDATAEPAESFGGRSEQRGQEASDGRSRHEERQQQQEESNSRTTVPGPGVRPPKIASQKKMATHTEKIVNATPTIAYARRARSPVWRIPIACATCATRRVG